MQFRGALVYTTVFRLEPHLDKNSYICFGKNLMVFFFSFQPTILNISADFDVRHRTRPDELRIGNLGTGLA